MCSPTIGTSSLMSGMPWDFSGVLDLSCSLCDERLGVVAPSECFFGCSRCDADLSSYNMVDAGPGAVLCLRCVFELGEFGAERRLLMATPMTLNIARMASHQMFTLWDLHTEFCVECGRGISPEIIARYGLEPYCFSRMILRRAGLDMTEVSAPLMALMYTLGLMGCTHGSGAR